jgi:serine/threonine protein kinase
MASPDVSATVAARYLIGQLIGRGGMGEVFEATDLRLDRPVALKRLRADLADDTAMRRRVQTEARLAARLTHPNVVTVFDSGLEGGHPFIVMERLEGRTLRDALASGPMAEPQLRTMALQVLDALEAAHSIGLIHRDVKPGNILAAADGVWKVADFGIATSTADEQTLTRSGELLGSASYLAPERLAGRPATPASDLYSLGVVLYEAAGGVRPFGDGEPLTIAMRIAEGRHDPLRDVAPELDGRLADAIERAMSLDPADRFGAAAEMAATIAADPAEHRRAEGTGADATIALERNEQPTSMLPPVNRAGARGPWPSRLLAILVIAAVIVAVAATILVIAAAAGGDTPSPGASPAATPVRRGSDQVPPPLQEALDRLRASVAP